MQLYSHHQDSNPRQMIKGTELLATRTTPYGSQPTLVNQR